MFARGAGGVVTAAGKTGTTVASESSASV